VGAVPSRAHLVPVQCVVASEGYLGFHFSGGGGRRDAFMLDIFAFRKSKHQGLQELRYA